MNGATFPAAPVAVRRAEWLRDRSRKVARSLSALPLELAAVVALAGVLDGWRLGQNGWANTFYSAAVRSMGSSWHDFLYASFDRSGLMTIDKTPLAVWVQALSVRAFGFRPLSILIPEALIGMATVALAYDLTRRVFGRAAGFAAGLALALTPITVAIARHNNTDAMLILCCVAALWCTVRALEHGRTLWIVLAGVCVGLGFETKMAVALLVVPGIVAAWLWVAPRGRAAAVGQLLQAGAAMVAVSVAWPLVVALTPAADRPWVGSTADNSIWSLIGGYNGVGRLGGQLGGPSAIRPQGGGGLFGGAPGPFRLVDESLGGQVGWLLGVALVGALAIAVASRLRRGDPRTGWLVAVGGAFGTIAIAFSTAKGIFHPYYVSLLAPFVASLVGAGVVQIARSGAAARWLAPLAVVAGAVTEVIVIHNNPERIRWLAPLVALGAIAVVAVLAVARGARVSAALLGVALAGLLVAPATWAVETLGHPTSGTFPAGGPLGADAIGGHVTRAGTTLPPLHRHRHKRIKRKVRLLLDAREIDAALRYARRHGGGTLGVRSQEQASGAIIMSGAHVAGLGGFSGAEAEMSVPWFAQAVHSGRIRWVLFNGAAQVRRGHRVGATKLLRAVAVTCRRVPRRAYARGAPMAHGALYDCRGHALALELYAQGVKPRAIPQGILTKLSHRRARLRRR